MITNFKIVQMIMAECSKDYVEAIDVFSFIIELDYMEADSFWILILSYESTLKSKTCSKCLFILKTTSE